MRARRARRALGAAALALVAATTTGAATAHAHAIVSGTEPGVDEVVAHAPEQVVMRFNEPVELAFGAVRVFDTEGRRVDQGDTRHVGDAETVGVELEDGLADGTYTVAWRVVSADGHPIHEAFVFHVGAPGENPEGIATRLLAGETGAGVSEGFLAGTGRWLLFASLLVLGGSLGFLVLWRRTAGPGRSEEVEAAFARRWRSTASWAWAGAVVGTVVTYVLQGAVAGDLPLVDALSWDVLAEVAETRFGRVSLVRFGLLAAVALVAWRRPRVAVAGALTCGLLATPALAGHAGTTSPEVLNVAVDTVHLGAAATWLGGLLVLLVGAFPAARSDQDVLAPVVARFSDVALVAVGLLVATGVARAWTEVGALRALSESYGVVLMVKVAVFLPIVALGAYNNRWLKSRVAAAAVGLRRLVATEVALGTVVVAATALLVNLPPARVAAGLEGPFVADVALGEYRLNVVVDPNEVGENEVHLTTTTGRGAPAAAVEEMKVLFRMPDEDIGPIEGVGLELAPGHFVVQGRQLSVAGRWVLDIVARTGRFDEERTRVSVRVN